MNAVRIKRQQIPTWVDDGGDFPERDVTANRIPRRHLLESDFTETENQNYPQWMNFNEKSKKLEILINFVVSRWHI